MAQKWMVYRDDSTGSAYGFWALAIDDSYFPVYNAIVDTLTGDTSAEIGSAKSGNYKTFDDLASLQAFNPDANGTGLPPLNVSDGNLAPRQLTCECAPFGSIQLPLQELSMSSFLAQQGRATGSTSSSFPSDPITEGDLTIEITAYRGEQRTA